MDYTNGMHPINIGCVPFFVMYSIRPINIALSLIFMIGVFTGSILTFHLRASSPVMRIVHLTGATVPTVHIEGIRNNALIGNILGEVRLVAGKTSVLPDGSGSFAIKDTKVLTNIIHISVPTGMKFVASKRGTKYYSVTSASAQQLSPDNRVYFKNALEAEKAGYKK